MNVSTVFSIFLSVISFNAYSAYCIPADKNLGFIDMDQDIFGLKGKKKIFTMYGDRKVIGCQAGGGDKSGMDVYIAPIAGYQICQITVTRDSERNGGGSWMKVKPQTWLYPRGNAEVLQPRFTDYKVEFHASGYKPIIGGSKSGELFIKEFSVTYIPADVSHEKRGEAGCMLFPARTSYVYNNGNWGYENQ